MIQKALDSVFSDSWKSILHQETKKDYFLKLKRFLDEENLKEEKVVPGTEKIFEAFNRTALEKIKVVILGQDPYHGTGQAHGLAFSVPAHVKVPPSLVNIYKELKSDLGIEKPTHGNLEKWADQGVLLLNATLTVREDQAGSHQKQGWEIFTDTVIDTISTKRENVVFLLWGKFAIKKASLIDAEKHLILTAAHPSPLSAYNGFFGCKHFSKTNEYLISKGIKPVDWSL